MAVDFLPRSKCIRLQYFVTADDRNKKEQRQPLVTKLSRKSATATGADHYNKMSKHIWKAYSVQWGSHTLSAPGSKHQ
jgi:hypothetical protein